MATTPTGNTYKRRFCCEIASFERFLMAILAQLTSLSAQRIRVSWHRKKVGSFVAPEDRMARAVGLDGY